MTVIKIEDVWMVKNPCAFDSHTETDPVYFFIIKTSSGYLQTKGMLAKGVPNVLAVLVRDMEKGLWIDGLASHDFELDKPTIFDNKVYPHLIVTKITDNINTIRTMWELVS